MISAEWMKDGVVGSEVSNGRLLIFMGDFLLSGLLVLTNSLNRICCLPRTYAECRVGIVCNPMGAGDPGCAVSTVHYCRPGSWFSPCAAGALSIQGLAPTRLCARASTVVPALLLPLSDWPCSTIVPKVSAFDKPLDRLNTEVKMSSFTRCF
jgi:hypothetical protein